MAKGKRKKKGSGFHQDTQEKPQPHMMDLAVEQAARSLEALHEVMASVYSAIGKYGLANNLAILPDMERDVENAMLDGQNAVTLASSQLETLMTSLQDDDENNTFDWDKQDKEREEEETRAAFKETVAP